MLVITKTSWIDEDAEEAEIIISDGEYTIVCFAHPWKEVQLPPDTVLELLDSVVMATSKNTDYVQKEEGTYEHRLCGTLLSRNRRIIQVGDFVFHIDGEIPGDIADNQRVEVVCDRISV